MTVVPQPQPRIAVRDVMRYAPLAIVGGAIVGYMISGFRLEPRPLLVGAIIGFICFLAGVSTELLLGRWFEAKPEAWWRRAISYFVASQIGWPLGLFIGHRLLSSRTMNFSMDRRIWMPILLVSLGGTLVGLAVHTYEALKERLRSNIEQLKEKEFADKELALAREFQARMLPAPDTSGEGYRINARNFAARGVAGDFYDVFRFADGAVGVAIADVAGKGMAASLIMAQAKAVVPLLAASRPVDGAMQALNDKLGAELSKRQFVAMALARFEPATGRVSISNAGLPDPYRLRCDGTLETIEVPGPRMPLALKRGLVYESVDLTLETGEALVFFSDGLPEATDLDGEPLGYERLATIITNAGAEADAIIAALHKTTNVVRDDDQTLVILRRI